MTAIYIFRIADGAIVERWGTFDGLALMQQIGVIRSTARWSMSASSQAKKEGNQKPDEKGDFLQNDNDKPQLVNLENFEQLKDQFHRDIEHVRIIALISPN